ncbi:MAG TPA: hypothetical protein VN633_11220, partial [Bryobacteraceae bacterium]|nr:hypothetical protein [Bryobacteraceae bacterium]
MRICRYGFTLLSVLCFGGWLHAQGGIGDPAVAPGSPASSYALNGLDHINYYTGSLNTAIPILTIGGRGGASRTITIPIQRQWWVDNAGSYLPGSALRPNMGGLYTSGYISLMNVSATNDACYDGSYWLGGGPFVTYVVWTGFDGTQTILKDTKSDGQEQGAGVDSCADLQGYTQYDRGKIFRATDGSDMVFVADYDVIDEAGGVPSGTLVMRDGTKLRFSADGYVSQAEDRNGNLLNLVFSSTSSGGLYTITDPVNRTSTINFTDDLSTDTQDVITYPGYNGSTRTIRINYSLLQNAATEPLETYHDLFPELNGSSSTQFNPYVISSIVLADGSQYTMRYNA